MKIRTWERCSTIFRYCSSAFINDFTTTYLLTKWDIRYEYNPPDTSAASDPDYFLNRMRERAAKHAQSQVDEAITSDAKPSERKRDADSGKGKKPEEITPEMNKGSWEYKSIVEKQHIKRQNFRKVGGTVKACIVQNEFFYKAHSFFYAVHEYYLLRQVSSVVHVV